MKTLINKLLDWALSEAPTGNKGTASRPESEELILLRSINKHLETLAKTVHQEDRHGRENHYVNTGHWNDKNR